MSDQTPLNPGIVKTVEWLRGHGFDTCDSGDGITHDHECDLPIPYVHMTCDPDRLVASAKRLASLLESVGVKVRPMDEGLGVPCIMAQWNPVESIATISLYNVTL